MPLSMDIPTEALCIHGLLDGTEIALELDRVSVSF